MNQKTISRASSSNGDFTRRSLMAGGAFAFGSAVITGTAIAAPDGGIIPARAIHQEELFAAAPARIYEALLDDKRFASFSGAKAQIDRSAGGTFSVFNGVITGRNIELVPNQRIVQAWRNIPAWPVGLYSIVRFELKLQGGGTSCWITPAFRWMKAKRSRSRAAGPNITGRLCENTWLKKHGRDRCRCQT